MFDALLTNVCFFSGVDEVDYSLYPDKEFQLRWLHSYLTAWHPQNEPVNMENAVETLYKHVNKFALVSFCALIFVQLALFGNDFYCMISRMQISK